MTIHKRVFSRDRAAGTVEYIYFDDETNDTTFSTEQDIEGQLEINQTLRNQFDERSPFKGDMHHVAQVPMVVLHELRKKGILGDQQRMKAWLNDPDNRIFRTRPGRV